MSKPNTEKQSITFDRAASFYDETRGFPVGVEQEVARLFRDAGELTAASRVIEPGIGTGRIALPIAALTGAHVVGVDLSVAMMNRLREKQRDENITLLYGDAMRLPVPSNAFDAAVVTDVFHLVSDWRAALAEVARVLKPDGVLLFPSTSDEQNPIQDAWDTVLTLNRAYRRGDFRTTDFLTKAGWQQTKDTVHIRYGVQRTPAELIHSLRNRIWSSTWAMTDAQIEQGIAIIEAAAAAVGGIDAPYEAVKQFAVAPFRPPA